MMHVSLVLSSSEIRRQMIFHVNHLSHIFHLMAIYSLTLMTVTSAAWSEGSNAICQILILRRRTVSFQSIKIKLVFVWGSTDGSFVDLMRNHTALIGLFIINDLSWVSHLIVLTSDIHRMRLMLRISRLIWILRSSSARLHNLSVVSSSLRTALYLILNLCSLFFVWLSNRNSLADLLLLWSIKGVHLVMRSHHESTSTFRWRVLIQLIVLRAIHINIWIINAVARVSFRRGRSVSSLSRGDPPLARWLHSFGELVILRWHISLLLLLEHHLLFYLLLVQLLRRGQIKIVDYVRDICNSIGSCLTIWTSCCRILTLGIIRVDLHIVRSLVLTLESILNDLSRFVVNALTVALKSFMRLSLLLSHFLVVHHLVLVAQVNQLLLFLNLNIFRCQVLSCMWLDMVSS